MSVTISTSKRCSVRLYLQLFVGGLMSYLRYLCLFTYSGVQHILCCVFVFLRLVYTMLPVSLDCPCLIAPSSCVHYVASFSRLSMLDCPFVLCTLCCQCLWIVHVWLPLRLVYTMLPVSLDCPCLIAPSSCVHYVASFSRLSMFDCPFVLCTLCCQCLWIVHVWLPLRLVYTMLPVSLDCPCLIAPSSCVHYVASFSRLSMFDCPFVLCTLCCQCLWIVHVWLPLRLVYTMLPVSLDCPCLIAPSSCVHYVASFSRLSIFDRNFGIL